MAAGEQAAAEGKAAARAQAGRELDEAPAALTAAEAALRDAEALKASPGRALHSPETLSENVAHALRIWDSLTPLERRFVRQAITSFAMITGLYGGRGPLSALTRCHIS